MTRLLRRIASAALLLRPVPSFNAGEGSGSVVINALSLPIDATEFNERNEAVALEVLPPPGADGILPARDGRRQRIADGAALVAKLNSQKLKTRVDFDHTSEPAAKTFKGSTEAEGWLSNFRLNARGGITADAALSDDAYAKLRGRKFRYLSPATWLTLKGDVIGLSSVALTNNPNLPLEAPAVNSSEASVDENQQQKQAELDERERKLKADEEAAKTAAMNAAEQAVDAAVKEGRVLPAQKDYHLAAIKANPDGIWKGIEAFNSFAGGEAGDATKSATQALATRTGPDGKPPSGDAGKSDPSFPAPNGVQGPSEERLELHAKIADYATKRGIPYRQAAVEFGAMSGV